MLWQGAASTRELPAIEVCQPGNVRYTGSTFSRTSTSAGNSLSADPLYLYSVQNGISAKAIENIHFGNDSEIRPIDHYRVARCGSIEPPASAGSACCRSEFRAHLSGFFSPHASWLLLETALYPHGLCKPS